MTPLEKNLRDLIKIIIGFAKEPQPLNIVVQLPAMATAFLSSVNLLTEKTTDPEEKKEIIRQTLDNIIGTEADALIGPDGELYKFDIPVIGPEGLEKISDVLIYALTEKLYEAFYQAA